MGEATVPAEQPEAGHEARVPAPDVHARRSGDHQGPAGQGPRPSVSLSSSATGATTTSARPLWRIRDRSTFSALRRARRVTRGLLTVAWLADDGPAADRAAPPRLAFAISRKVGPAVSRNRVRRRLRELARQTGLASGAWLVIVSPGAASAPFPTLAMWWSDAVAALDPGRPA